MPGLRDASGIMSPQDNPHFAQEQPRAFKPEFHAVLPAASLFFVGRPQNRTGRPEGDLIYSTSPAPHRGTWLPLRPARLLPSTILFTASLGWLLSVPAIASAWSTLDIQPEVAPKYYTAVYDSTGDRLIAFGGQAGSYDGVDVLSLSDGPAWSILRIPRGPSNRTDHASVLDSRRNRMLVIGGELNADVWELPLTGQPAWNQLLPGGSVPPGFSGHSAVYDSLRDQVLVFGGAHSGFPYSNDVWVLTLTPTLEWRLLSTGGGSPPARRDQTTTYDPVRDRLIVCDGQSQIGTLQDVWALSLSPQPVWNLLMPTGTAPAARYGHSAVYDPLRDRILYFSGRTGSGVWINDLWGLSLSGTPAWSVVAGPGSGTSGRRGAAACYDSRRDRLLVFGGQDSLGYRHDTWAGALGSPESWNNIYGEWGEKPVGEVNAFAMDAASKRVFVFGGRDFWVASLREVPARWKRMALPGPAPSARTGAVAVFDSRRNRVLVFGGRDPGLPNDLWAMGVGQAPGWEQLMASNPPGGRTGAAAVYDSLRDRMIVFGGGGGTTSGGNPITLGDMHAIDLSPPDLVWAPLPTAPPARSVTSVAIDTRRHQMLLFGGAYGTFRFLPFTPLGDLWRFDLVQDTWQEVTSTGGPSARWGSAGAYDPEGDLVAFFGGGPFNTPLDESWAFRPDGTWMPLPLLPHTLWFGAAEYFEGHEVVVFGAPVYNSAVEAWAHTFPPPPPPPNLTLSCPESLTWTAGEINQLDYRVSTDASGTQFVDYAVTCDRNWPGFPIHGYTALNGSAEVPIGIPVPDTAAAGVVTIGFTATLQSDARAADSCTVQIHDVTSGPPPPPNLALSCPSAFDWIAGAMNQLDYAISTDAAVAQLANYVVTCNRSWPGFPIHGTAGVTGNVDLTIEIPVPDTAAAGFATIDFTANLQSDARAADSCSVQIRGVPEDGGKEPEPEPILALRGATPNPAVREMTLSFMLGSALPATVSVYDIHGRRVSSQEIGNLGVGEHSVRFTPEGSLASGVYVVVLAQGDQTVSTRVAFVR